jgi:hypothetical protein
MITDPCVVRLLAEGGSIEIFGSKEPDGEWSFVGRCSNVEITDDGNDAVMVSGVPRCRDLAELVPSRWASLFPVRLHPDLRPWFRDRYESSIAALPAWQQESHEQTQGHRWRALFESTAPDRWSEEDEF